jgi:hypothetical protein
MMQPIAHVVVTPEEIALPITPSDGTSSTQFQDKFIAFVDILGFSDMVREAESKADGDFSRLLELTKMFGAPERGTLCPRSAHISKDLNFTLTQISDCAVISAEVSPAGVINLIGCCFGIKMGLINKGVLCRGIITRGNIFHTNAQFFGTGYMRAYEGESKVSVFKIDDTDKGTPFIEIDNSVVEYVTMYGDECVKALFGRMTKSDGTYTAIWPFDRLSIIPATVIGPDFDPRRFKTSVQRSREYRRETLTSFELAEAATDNERVKRKIAHYKKSFLDIIKRLDEKERALDEMIETGVIPYGKIFK